MIAGHFALPQVTAAQATQLAAAGDEIVLHVQRRLRDSDGGDRLVRETFRAALAQVAFVTQHLWNNGEPDGPPQPDHLYIGNGSAENRKRTREINERYILPVLSRARAAGLTVVHSQPAFIANRYAQYKALTAKLAGRPAEPPWPAAVIPTYSEAEMANWTVKNWPGWGLMDFPAALKPRSDEPVTVASEELDHVLRERGITTLIYAGYATDMCLIGYTGGLSDMVRKFGYRAVVLREATLATELEDGRSGPEKTRESLERIEREYASTASVAAFLAALPLRAEVPGSERILELPVQHRIKASEKAEQVVQEVWKVPLRETALVTMHLWNFAEIGGPIVPPDNEHRICVADGTLRNALRARRIDWVYVRPTLTAARRAGLMVIHAQPGFVATKYAQHQALVAEITGKPAEPVMQAPPLKEHTAAELTTWTGENWPQRINLDFPSLLKPLPDEPIVKTKEELDYVLKKRGIRTLIYAGYATNCCVIEYHCGLQDMAEKLGYRACVLREATLATECGNEDGVKKTAEALELIERKYGSTASMHDLRRAILPEGHNMFSAHTGWIVTEPNESYYPSDISDQLLKDWKEHFPYMREIGFTDIGVFCFLTYNLPVPLGIDTKGIGAHANDVRITREKVNRCREILRAARTNGIRLHYGLGLYSWNVSDLKDAYPEAAPNKRVLCGMYPGDATRNIPSSPQMMKDAVDFIVRELPELEGWWLTSGDHGRCTCDSCNERFPSGLRGNIEYFAATDLPIIHYIREKYPEMTIAYCTEVMNEGIEDPSNFDLLRQIAGASDMYLWGNLQKDPDTTVKRLAAECPKTGILFYQRPWQSTPPTQLDRDGWFMPNMINRLGRDMHRRAHVVDWTGVLACGLAKNNPADDLSMRFMARMMDEPERDPAQVARELLQAWYAPKTQQALDELLLVFTDVEDAFRERWPSWFMHIDMVPAKLGVLDKNRAWTPETAVGYINANQRSLARLRAIKPDLQNTQEVLRLETSIVKWIAHMKAQMRSEWNYEMP